MKQKPQILVDDVNDVPQSQRWTLKEPHKSRIEKGLLWAAENPPCETDLDVLLKHVRGKK